MWYHYTHTSGWDGRDEGKGKESRVGRKLGEGGVDGSAREERMRQSGRGRINKLMIYRVWYHGAYKLTDVLK